MQGLLYERRAIDTCTIRDTAEQLHDLIARSIADEHVEIAHDGRSIAQAMPVVEAAEKTIIAPWRHVTETHDGLKA